MFSRAVLGEGCPICAGRPPLREAHPSLAAEWHPTRNGKTAPDDVTAGSTRPAWWLGKCGHEWRAGVGSRARGAGCPYCSGKRALAGFNDLATTHPDLAAAWHPERNGSLGPADVVAGGRGERLVALPEVRGELEVPALQQGAGQAPAVPRVLAQGGGRQEAAARPVRRDRGGLPMRRGRSRRDGAQEQAVHIPGVQEARHDGGGLPLGVRLT